MTPFIFRNYMVTSNYRGSSRFRVWEAVRASSAAPGFFDDFHAKGQVFEDGALIANNPSLIGYHEASHLWPKEKLQCIVSIEEISTGFYFHSKIIHRSILLQVSLGNGRYEPLLIDPYEVPEENDGNYLSVKDKFSKLVLSATDTEMTHYALHDMLPDDKYFRFNPYLSGMCTKQSVSFICSCENQMAI